MIRLLDWYYSIIESLGVNLLKRWCNREHGTGYWQSREKNLKYLRTNENLCNIFSVNGPKVIMIGGPGSLSQLILN